MAMMSNGCICLQGHCRVCMRMMSQFFLLDSSLADVMFKSLNRDGPSVFILVHAVLLLVDH